MRKNFIIILSFLLSINTIQANKSTLTFFAHCDFFVCDNLGNIYTVDNFKLTKYDSTGIIKAIYDPQNNGKIGVLDITNPLKIMLFYPETNKIQYLDRTLTLQDESIDLFSILNENFKLSCTSYSNGIWLYNQISSTLYRTDNQLKKTLTIEYLNQQIEDGFSPNQLFEMDDKLYMGDPKNGVVIFDRWGAIIKKIPLKYEHSFSLVNDMFFYHRSDTLFSYNPLNFEEKARYVSVYPIKNTIVTKSNFYLQSKNDTIYRFAIQ
jgi:hypothetical protein